MKSIISTIQKEEDLFPMNFTYYIKKSYGILFFNDENKTSYDSNHAIIYRDKIQSLDQVLEDIKSFYLSKNIPPSIYQSLEDHHFFIDEKKTFNKHNFQIHVDEPATIMLLKEKNKLAQSKSLEIKLLSKWDDKIATDICDPSDESHEIEVFKRSIQNKNSRVFVAYKNHEAVGILNIHLSDLACCRFDYILISPHHRNKGYASQLLSYVVDYTKENNISNCFQWPANEHSKHICYQAGFRTCFTVENARASFVGK